jgi:putative flippase GtrA
MYKAESFSGFALPTWIPQVIKFSLVGILNTLLDAGIYLTLTAWLGFGAFPVLAKGIAYSIGISNSFIMNRSWTFDSDAKVGRSAGIFILVQIAALGINTGTLALGLNQLHLPELVALGCATLVTFGWNFVINKLVVFRR